MKIFKIFIALMLAVFCISGCDSNSAFKVVPDSFELYQNQTTVGFGMHTVILDENGNVYTFGQDNLGYASKNVSVEPVKIMGEVKQILTESANTMALKEDGSLWIWGQNEMYGQCGFAIDPANPILETPTILLEDVVFIAAQCTSGQDMVGGFAIKTDGTLWGWGKIAGNKNASYEKTTNSFTPFQIDQNVKMVYGSTKEAESYLGVFYYVKDDQSLWACGSNAIGLVGKGTTADDFYTPVKIMNHTAKITVGEKHILALKTDGTIWAWGNNEAGQIGKGPTGDNEWSVPSDAMQLTPVKILSNATDIAVGEDASYAIKQDGSLWGWGSNDCCQLGHSDYEGTVFPSTVLIKHIYPEPILIKENIKDVYAYYNTVLALDKNDTLYEWGDIIRKGFVTTPTVYMDNVKSASQSYFSIATIKNDNTIWLSGMNPFYEFNREFDISAAATPRQLILP